MTKLGIMAVAAANKSASPTQAQIEAAAREAPSRKVQLEYGEPQGTGFQAGEAKPAAAEVGDIDWTDIDAALAVATAATIERCAQVVENFDLSLEYRVRDTIKAIAAAIRALKE